MCPRYSMNFVSENLKKFTSLPAQLSRVGENSTHPHQRLSWYCSYCSTSTRLALCSHCYSQKLFQRCCEYESKVILPRGNFSHRVKTEREPQDKSLHSNRHTRFQPKEGTRHFKRGPSVHSAEKKDKRFPQDHTALSWEREPRHPREGFHLPVSVSIYHTTLG